MKESQTASWSPLRGASCLWERMSNQRTLPGQEPKMIFLWKPSPSLFHSLLSFFGCHDFGEALIPAEHPLSPLLYLPECGHLCSHIVLSILCITGPQCQPLPKLQPSILSPHTLRQSHLPCLIAFLTGTSGPVTASLLHFVMVWLPEFPLNR